MKLKMVKLAPLKPHPDNPNTHPPEQIEALGESLDKFKQTKNIVVWNDFIIAGHAIVESAIKSGLQTLEAEDISHWPEEDAVAYMLADIRLPAMAIVDDSRLVEALRHVEAPLDIPGFDEDFLKGLPGWEPEPPPEEAPPPIDRAEELQEEWQCKPGQLWQIESATNPGQFHRLICGDCRDMATVQSLTQGKPVNGTFTSPPYAMQRAKQYGGVEADKYVEWWDAVQENVRAALAEDGSFFVNIKPHCEDGQRVLYVFDLVLAMARRWGWRYVDELCWTHQGSPGKVFEHLKNQFEPVFQFSVGKIKIIPKNAGHFSDNIPQGGGPNMASLQGLSDPLRGVSTSSGIAYPGNVIAAGRNTEGGHAAAFPLKLPAFFIKAYSDPLDTWLDPFVGSGTTMLAAENEGRLGLGIEKLEKYVAVILQRFLDHTGVQPELIT